MKSRPESQRRQKQTVSPAPSELLPDPYALAENHKPAPLSVKLSTIVGANPRFFCMQGEFN